eukprot:1010007-Prymnesium_polylepis.2
MFVDNVGGVSIDDPLQRADGSPWMVERGDAAVQITRAWLHYEAAVGVIRSFGHMDADGKGVTPLGAPTMRAARAETRLAGGAKLLGEQALGELAW